MDRFDERLLEPVKAYHSHYKAAFRENAEKLFDSLVAKSGIDASANRDTTSELRRLKAGSASLASQISAKNGLRGFLVVLAVAAILASIGLGCATYSGEFDSWMWAVAAGLLALGIVVLTVFCRKIKQKVEGLLAAKSDLDTNAAAKEREAWAQMEKLNSLFDSHMTQDLMERTVPMLDFDYLFSAERYQHLHERYGFGENTDERRSTIGILSGEINGNPFVIDRNLVQTDGQETYYGSIVIHWTTVERDSKGESHVVHHSETLVASVTKFKPLYGTETYLIYGNDGAPDLNFSRTPSHVEKLDDKEFARYIARKQRKLERKASKSVQQGGSFTAMANTDFDTAFGALDRDNEVQFRLMYTPLAQNNTMDLLRDSQDYGDDFIFLKAGPLNYIRSEHAQTRDIDTDNTRFRAYDLDGCRKAFIDFNCEYFRSVFFDFAPLLCVPLYQQTKPHGFIYKGHPERNYTDYEAEFLSNRLGEDSFRPSGSETRCILKTSLASKAGSCDRVTVTAHSFTAEDRVDLIPRMGGDGHIHQVPVHWKEYLPVTASSDICVKDMKYSDNRFRDAFADPRFVHMVDSLSGAHTYSHGLLCMLLNGFSNGDDSGIRAFDNQAETYRNENRNSNLNNNISVQEISKEE